jgi:hypothetical protein
MNKILLFSFILKLFLVTIIGISLVSCEDETSADDIIVISFEGLDVPDEGYYNGSDGGGVFAVGTISFVNNYDSSFGSWNGVAYSTLTDKTTEGIGNQYSVYNTSGAGGSEVFGLAYPYNSDTFTSGAESKLIEMGSEKKVKGMYVCNTTYAYLSMKNGDSFAKKFGGDSGTDEDYLKLIIRGYDNNASLTGSVEFYLADYRSSDSSADYLIDKWTWVDLSSLGSNVREISFEMESSDTGSFGMNTPSFFAFDNLEYYK